MVFRCRLACSLAACSTSSAMSSVVLMHQMLTHHASPDLLSILRRLAHSGAETHRHLYLFWCELEWEVHTRNMCGMEARTFQSAAAQVEPAKISLAKVAVGKIDIGDVHAAQIDAAKVAPAKVARLAGLTTPIEFLAATFTQQQVQGIGRFAWFSTRHV